MESTTVLIDFEIPLTRRSRFLLTFAVYWCIFAFGLGFSMISSARNDIASFLGSNFAEVSYGTSARALGYAVGAIFFGWLFSKLNRQISLSFCLISAAVAIIVVPFVRTLALYMTSEVVYGYFIGGVDVATNSWILEIWQESANPFMQGLQSCFALGLAVGPLIEQPFLSTDANHTHANVTMKMDQSSVLVPYSVASGVLVSAAVLMMVLFFRSPYQQQNRSSAAPKRSIMDGIQVLEDESSLISQEQEARERIYVRNMIILGSLLLCFYSAIELSTLTYITEFSHVIELEFSDAKAAFLASVTGGAFAVNRLISIYVATKVKSRTMLVVSFVMLVIANLLFLLFANHSEPLLWTAAVIAGAGHSAVNPCILSFLEERINVTTTVCGIFLLSASVTMIGIPVVIGSLIEADPLIFTYLNIGCLAACAVIFAVLLLVDKSHRTR